MIEHFQPVAFEHAGRLVKIENLPSAPEHPIPRFLELAR